MYSQSGDKITIERISIATGLVLVVFGFLTFYYYGYLEGFIFLLPGILILLIAIHSQFGGGETIVLAAVLFFIIGLVALLDPIIPFIDKLNQYANLIVASATFVTSLVALYLGSWRSMLRKPKLKLCFEERGAEPYFRKTLAFGHLAYIELDSKNVPLYKPGFNARVKVFNEGKSTAKKVEVKVEKIELLNNSALQSVQHYHPTTIKWSGEFEWNPVDIIPKSHFFLDLFYSVNETKEEIINFNYVFYRGALYKKSLNEIFERKKIVPSGQIYWNVWVAKPSERGMPGKYTHQGQVVIHLVLNAENCSALRFRAKIDWSSQTWDKPQISIIHNEKKVKEC